MNNKVSTCKCTQKKDNKAVFSRVLKMQYHVATTWRNQTKTLHSHRSWRVLQPQESHILRCRWRTDAGDAAQRTRRRREQAPRWAKQRRAGTWHRVRISTSHQTRTSAYTKRTNHCQGQQHITLHSDICNRPSAQTEQPSKSTTAHTWKHQEGSFFFLSFKKRERQQETEFPEKETVPIVHPRFGAQEEEARARTREVCEGNRGGRILHYSLSKLRRLASAAAPWTTSAKVLRSVPLPHLRPAPKSGGESTEESTRARGKGDSEQRWRNRVGGEMGRGEARRDEAKKEKLRACVAFEREVRCTTGAFFPAWGKEKDNKIRETSWQSELEWIAEEEEGVCAACSIALFANETLDFIGTTHITFSSKRTSNQP